MTTIPQVHHRYVDLDDTRVFYRETNPGPDAPVLLLLHGFPSASHQFRRLIDAVGSRYRVVAPDYPGFGHTETPAGFEFTFDRLADVVESLVLHLGLDRFAMYLFDFGGPVGFRLAQRHPDRITALVIQNANAYESGLSPTARDFIALRPETSGAEATVRSLFTLEATRAQYEGGTTDPTLVPPDGWTLDQHFLDLPGRGDAQTALAFDYRSNLELYPQWQAWLREHRPPALIVWGRYDPFFPEPGAVAYRADLPEAEVHLLESGHFALEDQLHRIAPLLTDFLDRTGQRRHRDPARPSPRMA